MVTPVPTVDDDAVLDGLAVDDRPVSPTSNTVSPVDRKEQEQEEDDDDTLPDLPSRATNKSPDQAEVQSQLRQRRSVRSSFTKQQPTSPPPLNDGISRPPSRSQRRSSSFASQTSASSRPSLRSGDSFFAPGPPNSQEELHSDHEPTLWHSAPLLLAVLPAILGVAFKRGSVLLTDLVLLCLAAVYLNWCLVTPWNWYREARSVTVVDGNEEALAEDLSQAAHEVAENNEDEDDKEAKNKAKQESTAASYELALHELTALAACFVGPLFGAYLLHVIRTSLSSFGDELVSNMHLTLFVLAAELRPVRHGVKLVQARTMHLQRIVRSDTLSSGPAGPSAMSERLTDLQSRLDELERAVADAASSPANGKAAASPNTDDPPPATVDTVTRAQTALQTQIDALNRAVRRYEKRATAQTLHTESTLADQDARLRDALALAAAAARDSQKPGPAARLAAAGSASLSAAAAALVAPLGWAARLLVRALEAVGFVRRAERRRVLVRRERPGVAARKKEERERLDRLVGPAGASAARAAYR